MRARVPSRRATPEKNRALPAATTHAATTPDAAAPDAPPVKKKSRKFTLGISNCDDLYTSIPEMQNSLRQACARDPENYEELIKHGFVANLPKMMFVSPPRSSPPSSCSA
jgi:hypothetical protein